MQSLNSHSINQLLVSWYGEPQSRSEAEKQASFAQACLNRHSQHGVLPFMVVMQEMIADWWLGESQNIFPVRGMFYANTKRKMALYHLIAGQLLMSCKLEPAMDYLDMGFRHADGLISSENYFTLYNRHEELRFLKLSNSRHKPHSLIELLNESRVMRKLSPKSRYSIPKS